MFESNKIEVISRLLGLHRFANLLCDAAQLQAYMALGFSGPEQSMLSVGGWLGGPPVPGSRAPSVAYSKLGELNVAEEVDFLMTPVPGYELSLGWMGGVRKEDISAAVSKWAQEHDRLLALITVYAAFHEVSLHHVGFGCESQEVMWAMSESFGSEPIEKPVHDHMRIYHRIKDERGVHGRFYRELQFFSDRPMSGVHWDLITPDPKHLLGFVANAYGDEPLFWDEEPNSPVGAVWVKSDSSDSRMGVMARSSDWEIEKA